MKAHFQKYLAELLGTYGLVFCGTGAIVMNDVSGGAVSHVGVAITFGFIVMAMIYAFGDTSGAHINPAVTIAFWLAGRFSTKHLLPYIASQFVGALLASASLWNMFEHETLGSTIPAGTDIQSFVLEIILTFLLMLVILQVSTGSKEVGIMAGFAIGGVVLLEAMFAGPICGASMNPFRSLAPAIFSGQLASIWVYLIGPTLGAILAIPFHHLLKPQS